MKKITQKERVLQHLKDNGSITSWQAIKHYGCTRLSDVIYRLKEGYNIETETMNSKNRYGDKVHFAKYNYVSEKVLH